MSLQYWKQLVRSSPRDAAGELLRRVSALTPNQRRAALAWQETDAGRLADALAAGLATGGPLAGVPMHVKDLFDIGGLPTAAGSAFLGQLRGPAERDGRLVQRFRSLGAVATAKTQLHEFAYGLTGENPTFGDCFQYSHPARLTGGSSSGSAFSVQAELVPFAIGTDTGGSIRLPSAFCGLHGFRAIPGAPCISDAFPLAHSFDTSGWFTRSAADLAEVWRAWFPQAGRGRAGRGLYLTLEDFGETNPAMDHPLRDKAERLAARADSTSRRALLSAFEGTMEPFSVIQSIEAHATHAPWFEARRHQYDPAVWARIDRARHWSPAQRDNAVSMMRRVRETFADFFSSFDYLVMPVCPFPALTKAECDDRNRSRILRFTTPASLGGLSALALPFPIGDGLTSAVQVLLPAPDHSSVESILTESAR